MQKNAEIKETVIGLKNEREKRFWSAVTADCGIIRCLRLKTIRIEIKRIRNILSAHRLK